jgi:hypothetical protein
VAWIVRLVEAAAGGEERCADVMTIDRPDDLTDIANLGLTLAEAKRLLAGLQQEWRCRTDRRMGRTTPIAI